MSSSKKYANLLVFDRNGKAYRIPVAVDFDECIHCLDLEEEIWEHAEEIDAISVLEFSHGKPVSEFKPKEII